MPNGLRELPSRASWLGARGLVAVALALTLSMGGCDCRSRASVAEQVFENAARATQSSPERSAPGNRSPTAPCVLGAPTVLTVTRQNPGAISVHDGIVYFSEPTLSAVGPDGVRRELLHGEWLIRDVAASAAGVFMVTQSDRSPVRTRLVWRPADGRIVRSIERDDILLNEVVATHDGAYVLAGRVLDSQGPASQLLHFSAAERVARVVLDRDRGALSLVSDGRTLYWIEHPHTGRGQSGRSAIVSYRPDGGQARILLESRRTLSWLAADEEYLYWIERNDLLDEAGPLMRMPKTGGAATMLHASTRSGPLATGNGAVFAQLEGGRRLHRIDRQTGVSTQVVDDPGNIGRPVVSGDRLYWVTVPEITSPDTTSCIRSMPLPRSQ